MQTQWEEVDPFSLSTMRLPNVLHMKHYFTYLPMDNSSKQIFIGHGKEVHHFRPEVTQGKNSIKEKIIKKGKGRKDISCLFCNIV